MPLPLHIYAVNCLNEIAKAHDLKIYINAGQKRGWAIGAVFKNSVGETREYSVSLDDPYNKSNIDTQIETIKKDISDFVQNTENSWIK